MCSFGRGTTWKGELEPEWMGQQLSVPFLLWLIQEKVHCLRFCVAKVFVQLLKGGFVVLVCASKGVRLGFVFTVCINKASNYRRSWCCAYGLAWGGGANGLELFRMVLVISFHIWEWGDVNTCLGVGGCRNMISQMFGSANRQQFIWSFVLCFLRGWSQTRYSTVHH